MNGQTVAILESRLGERLAELIAKRGGKPLRAPALAEMKSLALGGERVIVQCYGAKNRELDEALHGRGATVLEIPELLPASPTAIRRNACGRGIRGLFSAARIARGLCPEYARITVPVSPVPVCGSPAQRR